MPLAVYEGGNPLTDAHTFSVDYGPVCLYHLLSSLDDTLVDE